MVGLACATKTYRDLFYDSYMYKQTYFPDRESKSMALMQLIFILPFVTNQYCLKIIIDDSTVLYYK